MSTNGYTAIRVTKRAHSALHSLHKLLAERGLNALPKGVKAPDKLNMSSVIEIACELAARTVLAPKRAQ
jgi:hypothetical protein